MVEVLGEPRLDGARQYFQFQLKEFERRSNPAVKNVSVHGTSMWGLV